MTEPARFRPQVRRSLRMHRLLASVIAVGVCLLSVVLGFRQSGQYEATSRVFVDPIDPGSISSQNSPGYDQLRYVSYVDQQMQTVTRGDTLSLALRELPAGTWQGPNESEQAAAARLAKTLKVERLNDGYEFSISLSSPDPATAAVIVNAVANAYLQGGRKDELRQADGRVQILKEERQRIKAELETDEREQAMLAKTLGVANPANDATNQFDTQLVNLRAELVAAREAHDVAAARLATVSGGNAQQRSGLMAAADEVISTDQGLGSMKSAINARRTTLESAMSDMTQNNPIYRQDQEELANLYRLQDAEIAKNRGLAEQRIEDSLRTDLERTSAVEAKLNLQLGQDTMKATNAEPKLVRAQELANDIRRLNDRYTAVDGIYRTLELQTHGPGMAHVSMAAEPPALPESNHRNIFLLAALPLGALFGLAAAVLARSKDQRVYIADDVEAAIGLAPLAVLPRQEEVSGRIYEEHVLRLAAGVEGAYRGAAARTFVVTAISAGTDTDTMIAAVASKLQELRLRTAVVATYELLLTSQETREYRAQAASAHRSTKEMPVPDAGITEGVVSQKLERMQSHHDVVLIAGPALLHSAETEYAVRCADATILVAESNISVKKELKAAADLLARLQVKGVALVLRQVRLRDADDAFRDAVDSAENRPPVGGVVGKAVPCRVEPELSNYSFDPDVVEVDEQSDNPSIEEASSARDSRVPHPSSEHDVEEDCAIESNCREAIVELEPTLLPAGKPAAVDVHAIERKVVNAPGGAMHSMLEEGSITATMLEQPAKDEDAADLTAQDAPPNGIEWIENHAAVLPRIESKIRFAYKEQTLNSRATWIDHLFRGHTASTVRVIPDEDFDSRLDVEYLLEGTNQGNGDSSNREASRAPERDESGSRMVLTRESTREVDSILDSWPLKAPRFIEEKVSGSSARSSEPPRELQEQNAGRLDEETRVEDQSAAGHALSRSWGLLSRYEHGVDGGAEEDRGSMMEAEPRSAREA